MLDLFIYFIGFLITAPMITTWVVYLFSMKIHHKKLKAFHTAVNWTTILYIVAVHVLLTIIFGHQFLGIMLILLIIIFACIIFMQWKVNTEIIFMKALKTFWRLNFLLFLFLYIILLFTGIIQRIFYY
ncbi:DUF3397 family protein [Virgibacillus byunsanensis]|uniref:DUF3397 family protein n=1 Tax=Virgibacillus byunsanensis TaxID=570945 RepID=A0ABW3LN70_9BACI